MSRLTPEVHHWPRKGRRPRARDGLRAVVVGGGIAGVAAASVLCERGVAVTLLEREAWLGGRAGGFPITLADGAPMQMERGFHGFFRQYYNLRRLLRRIDPALSMLSALHDYPVLGPDGTAQSFRGLPKRTPFQVIALTARTPYLRARDLVHVDGRAALEMLRYAQARTYHCFDAMSAAEYLDSLCFPEHARRMLFDVFSHSFFNPEADMSAAELLMMFHFYFTGNPEGLLFDVVNRPLSSAIWEPFAAWLRARGAAVHTGADARAVRMRAGRVLVEHRDGEVEAEMLVLALDVGGLQALVAASPDLRALAPSVSSLRTTNRFGVLRLWLDRPMAPERAAFAGTTSIGQLDNISLYDRFQDESVAWAARSDGSVVELHAYAVPDAISDAALRLDLLSGLHTFYPEARGAKILDEHYLVRQDCPAFAPGGHARRPTVSTTLDNVAIAGDCVRVPMPCALMERAAVSGFLAANTLLAAHDVAPEPIASVPRQGLLSAPHMPFRSRARESSTWEQSP